VSLELKDAPGGKYLYFKYSENGRVRRIYLGRDDNPIPERIMEAIEIVKRRKAKYEELENYLSALLVSNEIGGDFR